MSKGFSLTAVALCAGLTVTSCGDDGDATPADTSTATDATTSPDTDAVDDTGADDTGTADDLDVAEVVESQLPIGRVFVQDLGVGLSSYHFDAPDDVYIDFSRADAMGWVLDSGAPMPAKKSFVDIELDYENRRFTGSVDWSDDPVDGEVLWQYDMRFSTDFDEISGGALSVTLLDGTQGTYTFGVDLAYRAVSADDPYPFAIPVDCATRPSADVVFVGFFADAQCTQPTGTVNAFPRDASAGCCDGSDGTQTSYFGFACTAGDFSWTAATSMCGTPPPISETYHASSEGCEVFSSLSGVYVRLLPGGACVP